MVPNYEYILSANPAKKLRIQYSKMRENYTEEAAEEYKKLYDGKSLRFLLENARYIITEAYFGSQYFLDTVVSNKSAITLTEAPAILGMVRGYIQEHGSKMGPVQRGRFESLESALAAKVGRERAVSYVLEHAFSKDPDAKGAYDALVDEVFEKGTADTLSDVTNPVLFYAVAPFVSEATSSGYIGTPERFLHHVTEGSSVNQEAWKTYVESVISVTAMSQSPAYESAVKHLPKISRFFFESLAKESIREQMRSIYTMEAVDIHTEGGFNAMPFDTYYSTPQALVNRIFEDDVISDCMKESVEESKHIRDEMATTIFNTLLEYVQESYYSSENPSAELIPFDVFGQEMTLESAFLYLSEDVGQPSKAVSKLAHSSLREEKKPEPQKNDGVKPSLPKKGGVLNKITTKAMDAEAKQLKTLGKVKQGMQALGGAAKAVTALPRNIADMISSSAKEWDQMDEEKRRQKILESGYRNKTFRNMKLSLMYGATAATKLSLVPWLFCFRHLTKSRDERIRQDLIHEIDTEIKVCEEKISDASSAGDQKQKYELMRIKAQLEKEAIRVKSNSNAI